MGGPAVIPGVLQIEPVPPRPGFVAVTFLSGPRLTVDIPRAKVQEILDWWLTIAPEVAVDGYIPDDVIAQFRDDIIAAAVPDTPGPAH
ncbi:hypothetical protein [Kineosporia sp. NBRC 101731]|uniref:hypothetical protein n=1 Tax=Kineosporia sp. NBRC 101731 TaxID=3032199 RepID=UPI00249FB7F5|nr:hypothetical protein [Kineosporia sp. NBRC 101731]GLY29669.1 hypothetical protein Kisp02_30340 [Kineosporia sp. NBRC 101731]